MLSARDKEGLFRKGAAAVTGGGHMDDRIEGDMRAELEHSRDLLRIAELKFRNLVELSPDAISIVEDGKIIFCNNQVLEMFGYSREEMIGMDFAQCIYAPDKVDAVGRYRIRAEGTRAQKGVGRYVRKDGEVRWLEATGQQIEWEGRPAVVYFSSDITERKRAEEAIRESEEKYRESESKYRRLIEAAPEAISVVDDGKVVFCNSRLLDMLGFSLSEMIGTNIAQLIHKDDVEAAMTRHAARQEGTFIPKTINRNVKKDGTAIWVESLGLRIEWEGRPVVLYFASDVTERTCAEAALRSSEEKYRTAEKKYRNLIEVAPHAIAVVEDARITFVNTRLLELIGYSHGEMLGMPLQSIIYGEDLEKAMGYYLARADGGVLPKSTIRFVPKCGGVIWVETTGQRIEWEGRPAVLYFSVDVTERKLLEEQFAQAQKMEAVGRLAGGIAHDFNNLLQVILGSCTMMRTSAGDRNAMLSDLQVIETSGRRAASLTQQLLAFSRKQVVQTRVIDLRELVQQSEMLLSRILGEDIGLAVVESNNAGCVWADPGQLQQVILNLALNARDAMPAGGQIAISVENASLKEAEGYEIPAGDYVSLTVSDTGHGMDARIMDHLFEPFFTTKGLGKGTGLGLSIVYGIVKQCGGFIKVESTVGVGSMFTIHLPRVFEPVDHDMACAEREGPHGSGSILLVEDEAAVRNLVRKILESGGYTVAAAEGGEEALRLCREHEGGFDLLITDIVLVGMRGGEVAERVCKCFPLISVIYMTGYADQADVPPRDTGAPVLLKPFAAADLLAHVRSVLSTPHAAWPAIAP
jgi:two-component system cell cycle sensor histidine kinase/response regulator CckA